MEATVDNLSVHVKLSPRNVKELYFALEVIKLDPTKTFTLSKLQEGDYRIITVSVSDGEW